MTESECREVMRADNPDFTMKAAAWLAYPRGCWVDTGKYNGKEWKVANWDVYYFNTNKISFEKENHNHKNIWLAQFR